MFVFPMGGQSVIIKNITISSNQTSWNLITDGFGGTPPSKRAVVTITVEAGVDIDSGAFGTPAMDLRGLHDNSEIFLINNGNVYGKGGNGGGGESAFAQF